MQPEFFKNNRRGYLIFEALIAIVILGIFAVSIFPVISFQLKRSKLSQHDIEAASLLQEGMEVAYNVFASADWDTAYSAYDPHLFYRPALNSGRWVLTDGVETNLNGLFKRQIQLENICRETDGDIKTACNVGDTEDPKSKKVTVTLTWQENAQNRKITADLLLVKLYE